MSYHTELVGVVVSVSLMVFISVLIFELSLTHRNLEHGYLRQWHLLRLHEVECIQLVVW